MAAAGVASRRKAEQLIVQGRVSVNGQVVTQLGSKADPERDKIRVDGQPLRRTIRPLYFLLNKPVGTIASCRDPERRPTVLSLLRGVKERVYPVGRLDYHSSGLMLLTNDGDLTNFMMSRSSAIPRTYHVKLEGRPTPGDLGKLERGIVIDGRKTEPCQIRPLADADKPWYEITLVEGRYHQVRRMFERVGQAVIKLKRVRIGFLTDRGLAPGQFRPLTSAEVHRLKSWKAAP